MNNQTKIAAVFVSILTVLVIVLSIKLLNVREAIGEAEHAKNLIHNSRIAIYDNQINDLNRIINNLRVELDSLENEKQRIKIVTIAEIDSIKRLPFDGQSNFWTIEISKLDSSRARYISRNHEVRL